MSAPEEHNGMLDWYIRDKFSMELTSYQRQICCMDLCRMQGQGQALQSAAENWPTSALS